MNILGLDNLVFGVDDVSACNAFLSGMGLRASEKSSTLGVFHAMDGTGVTICARDDTALPAPLETGSMLRETVYGVDTAGTLDEIAAEMRRDRTVERMADGSIRLFDDLGFALRFRVTVRKPLDIEGEAINIPGREAVRGMNKIGVDPSADLTPVTLSHVVYFLPDIAAAEQFYTQRLGFRCVDRFTDVGPFLRPAGAQDHHTLFMLQTPPHMKGIEHFAFHMAGPTGVLTAGTGMVEAGYESFWGPGRHRFGSNWFWYFNCPMGCHAELDADMDRHDDSWIAREAPISADTSSAYLFEFKERWFPGGRPTGGGAGH